jgi:hypothetical protein
MCQFADIAQILSSSGHISTGRGDSDVPVRGHADLLRFGRPASAVLMGHQVLTGIILRYLALGLREVSPTNRLRDPYSGKRVTLRLAAVGPSIGRHGTFDVKIGRRSLLWKQSNAA